MRVVLAPDKLKGTITAGRAAVAMAEAARNAGWDATEAPVADGGEGTLEVLAAAGFVLELRAALDQAGGTMTAPVARGGGATWVEAAQTAGAPHVPRDPGTARRASSEGVGRLIVSCDGPVVAGLGGVATTDGGTGAARAAGWRFVDRRGADLPPGGAALASLHAIEPPEATVAGPVTAACDVMAPLLGPEGAARRFSPQKGADRAAVDELEAGMERLAELVVRDLGIDVARLPGAGAAGGLGAGLAAFFGARLAGGFDAVAHATGFERKLEGADAVIAAEGTFDAGSLAGKAPVGVLRAARRAGVPCALVTGRVDLPRDRLASAGYAAVVVLPEAPDVEAALARATERALWAIADGRPPEEAPLPGSY